MREREYTLITGGAGFIGSNLADALMSRGEQVVILDSLCREGVESNVEWLVGKHGPRLRVEVGNVADSARVTPLVRGARRVYHLAAQVAVTTSLEDPRMDLQSNLIGTFNVLEAARSLSCPPAILFTSTNKVYGGLDGVPIERVGDVYEYADGRGGITEAAPLDFRSPYGCSKGAADQYVRDYARIFEIPTVVFRLSCIYGTRQFGTEDQGWVAHFARAVLADSPITIYGDGCQVRDILWVGDLVDAMQRSMERAEKRPGDVFNIGGGVQNAVSVRQVIDRLIEITGRRVPVEMASWRPGDQRIYITDTAKARRELSWRPTTSWDRGLERLIGWLESADLSTPVLPLLGVKRSRQLESAAAAL
ncbi:MAG: GDP-mannose 4,6-dehydratase [Gemmatimonadota bacterium]